MVGVETDGKKKGILRNKSLAFCLRDMFAV